VEFTYSIPQRFDRQADTCAFMGSHLYGELCRFAARAYEEDSDLRALLDRHADRSRLVLRLLGAAHFRALQGSAPEIARRYPSTGGDGDAQAAWRAITSDVRANAGRYDELLARPVQTNEVARAMPVLAAMLAVANAASLPLRIFEIGSSAGLILNFDRYLYSGEGWSWGDAASTLHLRNRASGGAPAFLDAPLEVAARAACDLYPLDVSKDTDADTLLSFVWPDQSERFERLKAAIAIARAHPVRIEAGDGIAWIARTAAPVPAFATVALHTVVTEHMPQDTRRTLSETMMQLGAHAQADAPFAWVRMEPGERGYKTSVTLWPGEREIEVAVSDGHAQDLRWTVPAA
jgi:hypothetical protein